ncbi:MAG: hypothetical protein BWX72_00748 [Firmicutes bacterium ADurb.Bin080]|jgi:hypothetical protein|nr:leucine-rich repeat domain-containing protein [Clostridiales bacterium]OQC16027.1 MAG: hypothetical protein BWX72_00748 [Firmicutes bacterium ADurb.Bin080]
MQKKCNRRLLFLVPFVLVLVALISCSIQGCANQPQDNPDLLEGEEDLTNNNNPDDNIPGEVVSSGLSMILYDNLEGYFVSGKGSCQDVDIIIPQSLDGYPVIGISDNAFKNDPFIESIFIPETIVCIEKYAFLGCGSLSQVTFGSESNLRVIGEKVFSRCEKLELISLPDGIEEIQLEAFSGCNSLISIVFPDTLFKVGRNAFEETIWWEEQEAGVVYAGKVVCGYKYITNNPSISLVVEEGCVAIADYAFFENSKLVSIFLPRSIMNIGYAAFSGCENLNSITVDTDNSRYYASNNCLIQIKEEGNELILGVGGSIILPDSVHTISDYAFYNCVQTTTIVIPEEVSYIGKAAFKNCLILSNLELPQNLEYISEQTFYSCSSLESIFLPSSILEIKASAFSGCTNLTTIFINSNEIVFGLTGISAEGNILQNSKVIYINKSLTYSYGAYLLGHFSKEDISEYQDYHKYSIILQ